MLIFRMGNGEAGCFLLRVHLLVIPQCFYHCQWVWNALADFSDKNNETKLPTMLLAHFQNPLAITYICNKQNESILYNV